MIIMVFKNKIPFEMMFEWWRLNKTVNIIFSAGIQHRLSCNTPQCMCIILEWEIKINMMLIHLQIDYILEFSFF